MEWPDSRPKRNVPAARAASREKVKLKNLQIFQFYKYKKNSADIVRA